MIVLYTFRRCPYAIRARMGLSYAGIRIEQHEVDLKNKPAELIRISPKATVPVLVLENGHVIDQSLDIIKWALHVSDPKRWLRKELEKDSEELIYLNDFQFKPILDKYKYLSRSEPQVSVHYRDEARNYLAKLNELLMEHKFLLAEQITLTDIAIFPFIRQFYMVDEKWFKETEYTFLINWLHYFLESEIFLRIMEK